MSYGLSKSIVDETIELMHETSALGDQFLELAFGFCWTTVYQTYRLYEKQASLDLSMQIMTRNQKRRFEIERPKMKHLAFPEDDAVSHFRSHLSDNGEMIRPDINCGFCNRRKKDLQNHQEYSHPEYFAFIKEWLGGKREESSTKPQRRQTGQSIEGIVNLIDGNPSIILPKSWLGKKVRVSLAE